MFRDQGYQRGHLQRREILEGQFTSCAYPISNLTASSTYVHRCIVQISYISNQNHDGKEREILDMIYKRIGSITDGAPECNICSTYTQEHKLGYVPEVDSKVGGKNMDEANRMQAFVLCG